MTSPHHNHIPPQQQNHHNNAHLCSRHSLMVLSLGVLIGYLIMPVLMVRDLHVLDQIARFETTNAVNQGAQKYYYVDPSETGSNSGLATSSMPYTDATSTTSGTAPYNPSLAQQQQQQQQQHDAGGSSSGGGGVTGVLDSFSSFLMDLLPTLNDVEKRLVENSDTLSTESLPTALTPYVMKTQKLSDHQRLKILVTGGAGFVGSHLVDKLMMDGHEVIVVDNFFTGQKQNIAHWLHHPNFNLVVHDVIEPILLEVDQIYHLACPASPPHYQYNPVKTIKTSTEGTMNMLGLAKRVGARVLLASTSEIYGDPQVHPQPESYWGNVNTIGPRACYDEGKRVAETMMYAYRNQNGVEVRVARIFNTFGPRMHPNDGRVVSNFIVQALQHKNLTVYGDGRQTRSFQYVSDLVAGLHALMNGPYDQPVNLGNPQEYSVVEFGRYIQKLTNSRSEIVFLDKQQDDPSQRRPDITTAQKQLNWKPRVAVEDGLRETISYYKRILQNGEIIPTGPGASKPET